VHLTGDHVQQGVESVWITYKAFSPLVEKPAAKVQMFTLGYEMLKVISIKKFN